MTQERLLVDSHGRVLRDLRVSVTDRCNFRCLYCLPETDAAEHFQRERFLPNRAPFSNSSNLGKNGGVLPNAATTPRWKPAPLSFDEIERAVRIAVELGIEKVRL